jgi:hypothetical protein
LFKHLERLVPNVDDIRTKEDPDNGHSGYHRQNHQRKLQPDTRIKRSIEIFDELSQKLRSSK